MTSKIYFWAGWYLQLQEGVWMYRTISDSRWRLVFIAQTNFGRLHADLDAFLHACEVETYLA